ncbi:WxL domain-containing protein [Enterococcus gallinarum]|uniref:WxL domain-containing protein n=1 Tax=Enterococcus gallinarum TaxID=1353 RepID=UPI001D1734BD|nr:WxL domain-containing protein [Enterococcus gallinarum]MCC4044548.1 WxL domain-containing protein [Enterococcus gallinarum]
MKNGRFLVLPRIAFFVLLSCISIIGAKPIQADDEGLKNVQIDSSLTDFSATEQVQETDDSFIEKDRKPYLESEMAQEDTTEEKSISQDTGIWGNVPWEWDEEMATLTLQGGNAGTVATAPWKTYTTVQKIVVEDAVILQSNAANLFSNLASLIYIDALSFDTNQVTTMDFMFANCESLSVLNLNGWDTRNVRTVNRTFHNMTALTELDLSSWNTLNLTTTSTNSWFIFETQNLRTIHLGEKTTFLHMGSSSPRFPSGAPSNEYTGNWVYTRDQFGNQVEEREVAPRSTLLSTFYDGTQPGTYVLEKWQTIEINPIDSNGDLVADMQTIRGGYLEEYAITPPTVLGWHFDRSDRPLKGKFTEEIEEVNLLYRLNSSTILDPVDPEREITPEFMPEYPEELKSFRIDFAPTILFGAQVITTHEKTYDASPLTIEGSKEKRPNFVQVSNFNRNIPSWALSVRQESQFHTNDGNVLVGASLSFKNAELMSVNNQRVPDDYLKEVALIPEETSQLFKVTPGESVGTWIYHFGNSETMAESIKLKVPGNTMPMAKEYRTILSWTISAIP